MKQRDITLDRARGLAMLYIVCVVHAIYWLNIGSEPLRSFCLMEMPAYFIVSPLLLVLSSAIAFVVYPVEKKITSMLRR